MPCTLKDTSLVFALQFSLLKQYVYFPSSIASKEWSPEDTPRSWTTYPREGVSIYSPSRQHPTLAMPLGSN
jgi:hypothetical protein